MHLSAIAVGIAGGSGFAGTVNPRLGFVLMLSEVCLLMVAMYLNLITVQP